MWTGGGYRLAIRGKLLCPWPDGQPEFYEGGNDEASAKSARTRGLVDWRKVSLKVIENELIHSPPDGPPELHEGFPDPI